MSAFRLIVEKPRKKQELTDVKGGKIITPNMDL